MCSPVVRDKWGFLIAESNECRPHSVPDDQNVTLSGDRILRTPPSLPCSLTRTIADVRWEVIRAGRDGPWRTALLGR